MFSIFISLSALSSPILKYVLWLVLTNKPSIFFEVLKKANVLDVHFKEIYDLIGSEQPVKYHPEGDAYNHTMIVLDKVANS